MLELKENQEVVRMNTATSRENRLYKEVYLVKHNSFHHTFNSNEWYQVTAYGEGMTFHISVHATFAEALIEYYNVQSKKVSK